MFLRLLKILFFTPLYVSYCFLASQLEMAHTNSILLPSPCATWPLCLHSLYSSATMPQENSLSGQQASLTLWRYLSLFTWPGPLSVACTNPNIYEGCMMPACEKDPCGIFFLHCTSFPCLIHLAHTRGPGSLKLYQTHTCSRKAAFIFSPHILHAGPALLKTIH